MDRKRDITAPPSRGESLGRLTIGPSELAEILQCSLSSIYKSLHDCSRMQLPPRLVLPGSRRLLWLSDDVAQWLRSHREVEVPQLDVPRRRGRPCKQFRGEVQP